ncbi:DNA-directed RNA polymerase [Vibrio sp. WXL210]|uniref:DNA-directed RNA polymerase n=1 Tax=Vibrio sp. WXL210 TaxID=3450709 RepID=UPI003EC52EC5
MNHNEHTQLELERQQKTQGYDAFLLDAGNKQSKLEQQEQLEREMFELGEEGFWKQQKNNSDASTRDVSSIAVKTMVESFGEVLKAAIGEERARYTKGRKPMLLRITAKPDLLAFLTIRTLFNRLINKGSCVLAGTSAELAGLLTLNDPAIKQLGDTEATRLAAVLIELLCMSGDQFELELAYENKSSKNKSWIVTIGEEWQDLIREATEEMAKLIAVSFPMVVEPKPYGEDDRGGYLSDDLEMTLIKKRGSVASEASRKSINLIQKTPWQINTDVLSVMRMSSPLEPLPEPFDVPMPHDGVDELTDDQRQDRAKWHGKRDHRDRMEKAIISKNINTSGAMDQAKAFSRFESIYFPHNMDARSRAYPVGARITPQGEDRQKALIQLKPMKVRTAEGVRWMRINLANLVGHDKLKLNEREAWVIANESLIRDVVKNPYKCQLWHGWDKPYQGLAAAYDYVRWLDSNGEAPISTYVQLDG